MKHYLIFSILTFLFSSSYAQCDFTGSGVGNFDGANYNEWSYLNTAGGSVLASFSSEPTITHTGTDALKVDVTTAHNWGVRMFNKCNHNLVSGNFYTTSFWVYGGNGKQIKVALQHHDAGTVVIKEVIVNLTSDTWKEYSVVFVSNGNYGKGKVKITFPEIGVYYVDDLVVTESTPGASKNIAPNNVNIQYNGVASNTITASKASFYRFPEPYATSSTNGLNPWVAFTTANRAATSAGISIGLKTNSKSVKAKFIENTTYTGGVTTLSFAVYKNGEFFNVYYDNDDNVEFTFDDPTGATNHWEITMPSFAQVEFLGLEIDQTSSLEVLPLDTRPVYVAIGNSITHGVGQTKFSTHLTYPWQVADSLNFQLYNWGIGGSKVNELVFDNFATAGITPDAVSVLWGYNDFNCKNNCNTDDYIINKTMVYYENLMTNLAVTFPKATIVGILPTFSNTGAYTSVRSLSYLRTAQQNVITSLQASHSNIHFFNGNDVTNASSLSDDVHLNDLGATQVANRLIEEFLNQGAVDIIELDTLALRSEYEKVGNEVIDLNDSSEGSINYKITKGNANGYYKIDPVSGVLSIDKIIPDVINAVRRDSLTIIAGTSIYNVVVVDAYDYFIDTHPEYTIIETSNTIMESGKYAAYNNPWGVGSAKNGIDYRMATLVHSSNPDSTVFIWDTPSKANVFNGASVWCYNNILWGERYNLRENIGGFPIKVGDIKTLEMNFEYEKLFGLEKYKVALNQFFTEEDYVAPFSANDGDFFMVFDQVGSFIPSYKDVIGDTLIGGHEYVLLHDSTGSLEGKDEGYQFRRAIIKNEGVFSAGTVDLAGIYKSFSSRGFLKDDLYFPNVQFGIEVTEGWGAVRFNKFEINHTAVNSYTITYEKDGGIATNPTTYTTNTPTITLADATKSGYTFEGWYSEAGFINQVTEIVTGSSGNITLYAKYSNVITNSVSITDKNTIHFYPNPSSDYIHSDLEIMNLSITNLQGVVVRQFNSIKDRYSISDLESGVYTIRAVSTEGDVYIGKFRKE